MISKRPMLMFYASISLAILSSVLYHFSQKSTPAEANPAVALLVTYAVAIGLSVSLLFFIPAKGGLFAEVSRLNWASYLLALSIVGLEVGFPPCLSFRVEHRAGSCVGERCGLVVPCANCSAVLQGSPDVGQSGRDPDLPCRTGDVELEEMK